MQRPGIIIFFIAIISCVLKLDAQNIPYSERLITLKAAGMPMTEVFRNIKTQTGVEFSYTGLNDRQKISRTWVKKPLLYVLNDIFSELPCTYKIKDKYVIIKCSGQEKKPPPPPSVLSGYVYNAADSSRIVNASVYIKQEMKSSSTDNFGYFKISFSNSHSSVSLSVAKESYHDTTLIIMSKPEKEITIYLKPKKKLTDTVKQVEVKPLAKDTVKAVNISDSIKPGRFRRTTSMLGTFMKNNINFRNINDTLFRKVSFSLVPPVSTNRLLSVNTVNKVSVNLIAGVSKGIDIFELGGVLNIDNGNVKYFQAAGLGNIVAGNVKGAQFAGMFNMNSQQTTGFQAAGLYNQTRCIDGLQAAGLMNYADTVSGMQVAGLLNIANVMNGFQLSVFNFADKCSGVPFGFFSFVRKGYHKIEVSHDEMAFTYFALRSGVDKFHNIFFAGKPLFNNTDMWTYGYGLGTAPAISKKLHFAGELTSQQMLSTSLTDLRLNLLSRLFAGLEYRFKPYFSISAGPSYNIIVSDTKGLDYAAIDDKLPVHTFFNTKYDKVHIRMWFGWKISAKFF